MSYSFLIDTAIEAIKERYNRKKSPVMGDTVCAICSGSGKVYIGMNVNTMIGNIPNNIHAEIDALNKMKADNETVVKAITVFSSCNIFPIFPCNSCINLIMSLDTENANALIVTPGGNVNITEVWRYASNSFHYRMQSVQNMNGVLYMNTGRMNNSIGYTNSGVSLNIGTGYPPVDHSLVQKKSMASSLLKNRLNDLLKDE